MSNNSAAFGTTSATLGVNWKSALCVTSLYDSYVKLQRENESLRQEIAQLKQKQSQIRPPSGVKKLEDNQQDESSDEQATASVQNEVFLLRKEKHQLKEIYEMKIQQLESDLRESKQLYQEQTEKYRQRFELDPHETKRVAISVQTIQQSLDKALEDKERLAEYVQQLQEKYQQLAFEQQQTSQLLQKQAVELETRRLEKAKQTVERVLFRWIYSRISRAWQRWVVFDNLMQQNVKQKQAMEVLHRENANKLHQIRQHKAAMLIKRAFQSCLQRVFMSWKQFALQKQRIKQRLIGFQQIQRQKHMQKSWQQWLRFHHKTARFQQAFNKLFVCLKCHKSRSVWTRWKWHVQTVKVQEQQQLLLQEMIRMKSQQEVFQDQERLLQQINERNVQQRQVYENQLSHLEQSLTRTALETKKQRKRLRVFFQQRFARQAKRGAFLAWSDFQQASAKTRDRICQFQHQQQHNRLAKALCEWRKSHFHLQECRRVGRSLLFRWRQLSVSRCFNAWKEMLKKRRGKCDLVARVLGHLSHRSLSKSFQRWTEFTHSKQFLRQQLERMNQLLLRTLQTEAFRLWKTRANGYHYEKQIQTLIEREIDWKVRWCCTKAAFQVLKVHWSNWQLLVQNKKHQRNCMLTFYSHSRKRQLTLCWKRWQEFLRKRLLQLQSLERILLRAKHRILKRQLFVFQQRTLLKAAHIKQLEQVKAMQEETSKVISQLQIKTNELELLTKRNTHQEKVQQAVMQDQNNRIQRLAEDKSRLVEKLATHSASKALQRLLSQHFKAWVCYRSQQLGMKSKIASFQRRYLTAKMLAIFQQWHCCVESKKAVQKQIDEMQLKHSVGQLRACWTNWKVLFLRQRKINDFILQRTQKKQMRLYEVVFQSWKQQTKQVVGLGRIISIYFSRSVHSRLDSSLKQWRWVVSQGKKLQEKLARKQRDLRLEAGFVSRQESKLCVRVFGAWKTHVRKRKGVQRVVNLLKAIEMQQLQSCVLKAFASNAELKKKCVARLGALFAKRLGMELKTSFSKWRCFGLRKMQETLQLLQQTAEHHQQLLTLRANEIALLQEKNRSLELCVQHSRQSLEQTMLSHLEDHRQYQQMVHFSLWRQIAILHRRSLMVAEAFLKKCLAKKLLQMFQQWRSASDRSKHVQKQVNLIVRRQQLLLQSAILHRWAQMSKQQAAIHNRLCSFNARVADKCLRACWRCWKVHGTNQKWLKGFLLAQAFKWRLQLIRRALQQWKHHSRLMMQTQDQMRSRQTRIDIFTSDLCQKRLLEAFAKWNGIRITHRNRRIALNRFHQKRTRRIRTLVWCAWRDLCSERQIQQFHLRRLNLLTTRHHTKVAFARWYKAITGVFVTQLLNQTKQLGTQLADTTKQLEIHILESQDLQSQLLTSQRNYAEIQCQVESASQQKQRHDQELQQTELARTSLLKLCWRFCVVDRRVVRAFNVWRQKRTKWQRCQRLIQKLAVVYSKSHCECQWRIWKRHVTSWKHLIRVRKLFVQLRVQTILRRWRSYCRILLLRRLFLLKRIHYTSENGAMLPVSFRLWEYHAEINRLLNENRQLCHKNQHLHFTKTWFASEIFVLKLMLQRSQVVQVQSFLRIFFLRCKEQVLAKNKQRLVIIQQETLRLDQAHAQAIEQARVAIEQVKAVTSASALKEAEAKAEAASATASALASVRIDPNALLEHCVGLQLIFRRISQATLLGEVFEAIQSSFSQVLMGTSAVLFLLDPTKNELWSLVDGSKAVVVPATVGIAGYAMSSLSSVLIENAPSDQRFHPMIDQYVVAGLHHDPLNLSCLSRQPQQQQFQRHQQVQPWTFQSVLSSRISVFACSIVAADGAVCGVLEVGYRAPMENHVSATHIEFANQLMLFTRATGYYVEQMMQSMLKNCRDRLAARTPEKFTKLFKQNRNWRKYYIELERKLFSETAKTQTIEAKLTDLTAINASLQSTVRSLQQQNQQLDTQQKHQQASRENKKELDKVIHQVQQKCQLEKAQEIQSQQEKYHAQIRKLKKSLLKRTDELQVKSDQLSKLLNEFNQYRDLQQTKQLRTALLLKQRQDQEEMEKSFDHVHVDQMDGETVASVSLLKAESAQLQNQLVRAQADNRFLVEAIDAAARHQGQLPDLMRREVQRISQRIQQQTNPSG